MRQKRSPIASYPGQGPVKPTREPCPPKVIPALVPQTGAGHLTVVRPEATRQDKRSPACAASRPGMRAATGLPQTGEPPPPSSGNAHSLLGVRATAYPCTPPAQTGRSRACPSQPILRTYVP